MNDKVWFRTKDGVIVPSVTTDQMREVDRIAGDFGLGILQMMENAGRNLAHHVMDMLGGRKGDVVILAGSGGNGGSGLCCARHLHNRNYDVRLVLDREAREFKGAARTQLQILQAAGLRPAGLGTARDVLSRSHLVVDALVGYGLNGVPRGRVSSVIDLCNRHAARILSLDVPSGLDGTTGEAPGAVVRPERTLTLALPKTGLRELAGDLYLADVGIPPEVLEKIGVSFTWPFGERYWVRLESRA